MNRTSLRHRIGPTLFTVYLAAYALFVGVAAFGTFRGGVAVGGLAATAFSGLSVAVVGGFALILGAFILALLYAVTAPVNEERPRMQDADPTSHASAAECSDVKSSVASFSEPNTERRGAHRGGRSAT